MSTHPRLLLFGPTAIALVAGFAIGAGAVLAEGPTASAKPPEAGPIVAVGVVVWLARKDSNLQSPIRSQVPYH